MIKETKIIGTCGVDAGCLMVGDPCYFIGKDAVVNDSYKDWKYFTSKHFDYDGAKDKTTHQMKKGLGVVVNTVHGDGGYPVEGLYEDGILVEIRIKLI